MNLWRPNSLRQRLLLISTVVALVTLLVTAALFVANDLRMMRSQMVRDLEVLAAVVGDNCLSALVFNAPETAEKNLGSLRREYQIRYAILYDADGRPFAEYRRHARQVLTDHIGSDDGAFLDVSVFGVGTVDVVRGLTFDGKPIGRILIHAGTDELILMLRRYAWTLSVLFLVVLLVSIPLALRLQRQVSGPILSLAEKTREISEKRDYSLRVSPPVFDDEISALFEGFNSMLAQIDGRDRELNRIKADLEQANARLRGLAIEIALVGEREKKRLASELHDSPMQKLALAQVQIASAARRRDSESDRLLEVGQELMRDALQELRTLQFELSPSILYREGLAAALEWLASNTAERFGIDLSFVKGDAVPVLVPDQGIVLFQCARELVHNLVRHAQASQGAIELDAKDGWISLVVSDNGKGLASMSSESTVKGGTGYGLFSIRDRLSLMEGELSIQSDAKGTRAVVTMPLLARGGDEAIDRERSSLAAPQALGPDSQ